MMTKIMFKNLKLSPDAIFAFLFYAAFFLFFVFLGAKIAPDSPGYLSQNLLRAPLYPLFLKISGHFFAKHQLFAVVCLQLGIGIYAAHRFVRCLKEFFNLNFAYQSFLVLLFLSPYLGFVGNYILTESITYPLFLFSVEALIKGLKTHSIKYFLLFFLFSAILCLARGQFTFMYVVGLILSFYLLWRGNLKPLSKVILLSSFCLSIIGAGFLERFYHAYYHDTFSPTPHFAVHFVITPLYLSEASDEKLFQDSNLKSIFAKTYQKMQVKNLTHHSAVGFIDPPYHFYASFDDILYKALYPSLNELKFTDKLEYEKIMNEMAVILIKAKPMEYVKLYLRNFSSYFGGYYGFAFIQFLLLAALILHFKNKDFYSSMAFFILLLDLGNAALTSFVQAYHVRYGFYTQIILAAILSILIFKALNNFKILRPENSL